MRSSEGLKEFFLLSERPPTPATLISDNLFLKAVSSCVGQTFAMRQPFVSHKPNHQFQLHHSHLFKNIPTENAERLSGMVSETWYLVFHVWQKHLFWFPYFSQLSFFEVFSNVCSMWLFKKSDENTLAPCLAQYFNLFAFLLLWLCHLCHINSIRTPPISFQSGLRLEIRGRALDATLLQES